MTPIANAGRTAEQSVRQDENVLQWSAEGGRGAVRPRRILAAVNSPRAVRFHQQPGPGLNLRVT